MTPKGMAECLNILSAMPSGHGQDAKWPTLSSLYAIVLAPMEDGDALAAVKHAVTTEEWRPSPARLRRIAAEVASPVPDAEQSYAEIMAEAQAKGLFADPDPDRKNCYRPGPPPFSHPLVRQIVRYCGGWEMICSGEANMQEGLRKQVRAAHESTSADWFEAVAVELAKPLEERKRMYFPAWQPSKAITFCEVVEVPQIAAQETPKLLEGAPAEFRAAVNGLAKSLPAPSAAALADLERVKAAMAAPAPTDEQVEAELRSMRDRVTA